MKMPERADLVVVGGGVAGLYAALCASAEAVGSDDTPELHAGDTLRAGRGLCRPSAVGCLTEEAPARLADLFDLGVEFDPELGLEGGHSRRRVAHVGGAATGQRIARVLAARAVAHPRIRVLEGERVLALEHSVDCCLGITTERRTLVAGATLLATGGYAALWERTTNPPGAVGDGLVLAYRAGAALADLELVQFHPTVLADNGLLLSEALRGAGAVLVDERGRRFTDELAPRDVVARAVGAHGRALLDLRSVDRGRFPSLMTAIEEEGFDPGAEAIPVAPAAHYTMGGIVTDLHGRTEVPGLYAAGECACTGVHGANRLASNSLLECLVFGRRAALAALAEPVPSGRVPVPGPEPWPEQTVTAAGRRALWEDAGLVRDAAGLDRLRRSPHVLTRLIAESALAREESRGGHFRTDFPAEDDAFVAHTVVRPCREPVFERWS